MQKIIFSIIFYLTSWTLVGSTGSADVPLKYIYVISSVSIRIRSDPYHLAGSGSGSVSGNVDLDPGTKTKT